MKKITILYIILITSLFIFSCDKISPPFIESCLNCCGEIEDSEPIKIILIEEFTGHKCSNCPTATEKVKYLDSLYCDHVIVLASHPAGHSFTAPDPSGPFQTDFGNNDVATIGNEFGLPSLPNSLVNRINNAEFFTHTEIETEISGLLFDENADKILPDLEINLNITINTPNINIDVSINTFNELNGEHKLVVVISEDDIISGQKDGEQTIEEYEHDNVYRAAINGTWGETITLEEPANSINYSFNYVNSNIDDINNCSIVAYVYNNNTDEIVQAAKKDIN